MASQKWTVQRFLGGKRDGKLTNGGLFSDEIEAARKSDEIVFQFLQNGGIAQPYINFPDEMPEDLRTHLSKSSQKSPARAQKKDVELKEKRSSNYVGVVWNLSSQKWIAQRYLGGKKAFGGVFSDEIEAARKSDEMLCLFLQNGGKVKPPVKLNFPDEAPEEIRIQLTEASQKKSFEPKEKRGSNYFGVIWHAPTEKWVAERRLDGEKINGGSFSDEIDAARRSDEMICQFLQNGGAI